MTMAVYYNSMPEKSPGMISKKIDRILCIWRGHTIRILRDWGFIMDQELQAQGLY